MSRIIGNHLPSVLLGALSEAALSRYVDIAVPIVSVDERGRPHPALLSYGELASVSPEAIRLVIGGKSRTAANLRRNGLVVLLFVDPAYAYYVKGVAQEVHGGRGLDGRAFFEVAIEEILEDLPTPQEAEEGVRISSPIRFSPPPARSDPAFQEIRRVLRGG